jgi:putative membrane protein
MIGWSSAAPGWGWLMMGLSTVAFIVLAAATVVLLLHSGRTSGGDDNASPPVAAPPAQLLAARYAAGEIDEVEYRHRLAVLAETAGAAATGRPGQ